VRDVIAVSEPGTLVLLLATLVALRMVGRRRAMART
jgi:hypothetical protein